jgi:hypothetical protein
MRASLSRQRDLRRLLAVAVKYADDQTGAI